MSVKVLPKRNAQSNKTFRYEIHGIRGLAILGVVLFHIFGNGRVSGGVDAFLAISGFLAIPSLVRRAEANQGWINLVQRWSGICKRIFLPLIPVLLFVGAMGAFLFPLRRLPSLWDQELASLLGYENWALITNALDYDAPGGEVSPLQHLWSISVQLQFHLLLPLLVMIIAVPLLHRSLNRSLKPTLIVVLITISALSLFYAGHMHVSNQSVNYFSTWTRIWELTLPGAIALLLPSIRLSSLARVILSWTGIALLFSTGFVFYGASSFPSYTALWPVGGLLLVLIAGKTDSRYGPDKIWRLKPVTFLADIAYSLYLWHWPILIFWFTASGKASLPLIDKAIVVAVSISVAWFSYRVFEKGMPRLPLFSNGKHSDLRTLAIFSCTLLLLSSLFITFGKKARENINDLLEPGIEAKLLPSETPFEGTFFPDLDVASLSFPTIFDNYEPGTCRQPGTAEAEDPFLCETIPGSSNMSVLITGGSHVDQWWGALEEWAEAEEINLILMGRGGCHLIDTYSDPSFQEIIDNDPASSAAKCYEWNRLAMEKILEVQPEVVITLATTVRSTGETIEDEAVSAWQNLNDSGIKVLAVRDSPWWGEDNNPLACISKNENSLEECTLSRDTLFDSAYDETFPGLPADTGYLDLVPYLCPDDVTCPAVIGPYIVYRDYNHVTQPLAQALSGPFVEKLTELINS